jgi:hypothetical protein
VTRRERLAVGMWRVCLHRARTRCLYVAAQSVAAAEQPGTDPTALPTKGRQDLLPTSTGCPPGHRLDDAMTEAAPRRAWPDSAPRRAYPEVEPPI